jgi:mono/diheme cytochrome c family protein
MFAQFRAFNVTNSPRLKMKSIMLCCCASLALNASAALGADAEAGKRLARQRCAVCHIVEPNHRHEVARAPPFEAIRRKFGADPAMLAFNLMGPHAIMHVKLRRRDAVNVAEYIRTLVNDNEIE